MIRFDRVSKRYESGHDALMQVSFDIADEEMVFLTGHSGAGKSTLLKLIALIERPTRGSILVNDRNTAKIGRFRVPYYRREIGIVFQNNRLLMDRTVFDNVALPLVVSGCEHRELGRRVRAALDKVGLLKKERDYPITLSGGEQQRVGIARAVVNKPPLLVADEPTGNLDDTLSTEIMDLLADFNHHGVTVLIATHDLRQVQRLGRRVLELHNGQLDYDGAPAP
ncbi:MAG: cell division ATP-binding protein FtsE [Acidiferrobacterales bacterium]|jgi:cell division transport system ATP-binding protein|nr:cell division ATP-binding protein FtsE [Acidiferrobacterales bacterium]